MDDIHIVGGAGFIGSNLVAHLNGLGIVPTVWERLDQLTNKISNLAGLLYRLKDIAELEAVSSDYLVMGRESRPWKIVGDKCVWLAANVDTTEPMSTSLWDNNVACPLRNFMKFKKVIYASSASVYGNSKEFREDVAPAPINSYSLTKQHLEWRAAEQYPKAYGLRFFNVYAGPGDNREKHKGAMESFPSRIRGQKEVVVYKTEPEARRDFVWVSDVAKCITWFLENEPESGVYNVGSGCSTSFSEIAAIVCPDAKIVEGPLPEKMKAGYQFASKADLTKLRAAGYKEKFHTLAEVYD